MKLKHLQVFEAFESTKLSKTLKFINKESQKRFLDTLKQIGNNLDFPISEFKDEYFEYLPFKSALKKNVSIPEPEAPQPCDATSMQLFGTKSGIEGEKCEGGRIKRMWGKGIRSVTCPKCTGTGFGKVKPVEPTGMLIKFWFDKNGKFTIITATDGKVREQYNNEGYGISGMKEISKDINDYNVIKNLSLDEVKNLPTGSVIYFANNRGARETVAQILKTKYGSTFAIQDAFEGSRPDEDGHEYDSWSDYGDFSWKIRNNGDMNSAKLLKLKTEAEEVKVDKSEVNWYIYNNLLNLRYMDISNQRDMESRLKDSHFAIILDYNKLKSSKYQKASLTRIKRDTAKSGAFIKPEDIKKANINRYIDMLSKQFNISGNGIKEITKVIPRALGWANSITFLYGGINMNDLKNIISYTYRFMKENEERYKKSVEQDMVHRIKIMYDRTAKINLLCNQKIQFFFKELKSAKAKGENIEKINLVEKVFSLYLEVGSTLNKKISIPVETITDMQMLYSKVLGIQDMWSSDRFDYLKYLRRIQEYSVSSYDYSIFEELMDKSNETLNGLVEELTEFKSIIEKY